MMTALIGSEQEASSQCTNMNELCSGTHVNFGLEKQSVEKTDSQ